LGKFRILVSNKISSALLPLAEWFVLAATKNVGDTYDWRQGTIIASKLVGGHLCTLLIAIQELTVSTSEAINPLINIPDKRNLNPCSNE